VRGFSETERHRIREQLLNTGRELFARFGLKKTTIADLTDPVGIANSTFYVFYDSKEELYLEILEQEGEEIAERVIAESFEAYDDPEKAITAFLHQIVDVIETDPLIHRLIAEDELEQLARRLPEEELTERRAESLSYLLPHVERWQEASQLETDDLGVVVGAIRAVTFLPLHEGDIGEKVYPAVRDLVIEAVAAELTQTTGDD